MCTYCCKIVLSCAQTSLGDIKMLHDDLSLVASEISSPTPDSMTPRKKIDDSSRIRQRYKTSFALHCFFFFGGGIMMALDTLNSVSRSAETIRLLVLV